MSGGLSYLMRYFLLLLFIGLSAFSKDLPVANASSFASALKQVQPGDSLVLAAGEWPDAQLVFTGKGNADGPIVLKAAVLGKTVFTGKSMEEGVRAFMSFPEGE